MEQTQAQPTDFNCMMTQIMLLKVRLFLILPPLIPLKKTVIHSFIHLPSPTCLLWTISAPLNPIWIYWYFFAGQESKGMLSAWRCEHVVMKLNYLGLASLLDHLQPDIVPCNDI